MQIIIKEEEFTYMYDSFVPGEKGEEDPLESYLTPEQAIEIALDLLSCSYGRKQIEKAYKEVYFLA